MTRYWRRTRPRPLRKTLSEVLFFVAILAAVLYGLKSTGLVDLGSGPIKVVDGDSLRRGDADIRLYGIDAPEYRQMCRDDQHRDWACGRSSADALRDLIDGRDAACVAFDQDRYGRNVAECTIGTLDLAEEMVRQGWALAYRRHSFAYVGAEAKARKAKRGIWRGTFEDPEAYRAREAIKRGDAAETGFRD